MSEGSILDLEERIKAELDRLREARPDLYAISGTMLGGWDVDTASGDYWLDVQVGNRCLRVTEWDDWEAFKWQVEHPGVRFPKPLSPVPAVAPSPSKNRQTPVTPRPELSPWILPDRQPWGRTMRARRAGTVGREAVNGLRRTIQTWVAEKNRQCGRIDWVIDSPNSSLIPRGKSASRLSIDSPVILRHVATKRIWWINNTREWLQFQTSSLRHGPHGAFVCPHCGIGLKPARLIVHVGICPKRDYSATEGNEIQGLRGNASRSTSQNAGDPRLNGRGLTSEDRGFGDPLDATKNLGFLARDHGRFGSPSIHDGYGDGDNA